MAKKSDDYFVEKRAEGWAVCRHQLGAKTTLCVAAQESDANAIQAAMIVFPYAQVAAGELVDEVQDGPGQEALIAIFKQLHALERKAAFQREIEAFFHNLVNITLAIFTGIGILSIIAWIIRYFL